MSVQVSEATARLVLTSKYGQRFVDKVYFSDGCWLWLATKSKRGYGKFSQGRGHMNLAHRLSYLAFHSDVPNQVDHLHTCSKACVNPLHLRAASGEENQRNRKGAPKHSSTGVRGVTQRKGRPGYRAHVQMNGRMYSAGTFAALDEAERAVIALRNDLFGKKWAGGSR